MKKLSVKKTVIANLNNSEMQNVAGGSDRLCGPQTINTKTCKGETYKTWEVTCGTVACMQDHITRK